jgi:hypothetical protein
MVTPHRDVGTSHERISDSRGDDADAPERRAKSRCD